MLKHADIWRAIDSLATRNSLSPSGLARKAGLDPTTFNKSKRITPQNKQRWPSTESIAKILAATNSTLAEFVELVGGESGGLLAQRIPVLDLTHAASGKNFDPQGRPTGNSWDETLFAHVDDPAAYGLEIIGSLYAPIYNDGNVLIVSPAADLRRGDRVAVMTKNFQILIKELIRNSPLKVELKGLGSQEDKSYLAQDIIWIARILWVSQ
ncbi:helix-turn-helix transcriptional regulator [Kiloniella laminariae]|uniref:Helix-turn-helix transcriptional regulator n=1 Tax=Kiloniella laminariae TaxID=454162 RepID=A0ABT4LM89_9PROT|nr:helix-turn-helix transcriptional regulator [Kiloniella laminariae]MCZ4282213.1 helix-turn-helix transcriptional regulator [Kiloniella laminariae]